VLPVLMPKSVPMHATTRMSGICSQRGSLPSVAGRSGCGVTDWVAPRRLHPPRSARCGHKAASQRSRGANQRDRILALAGGGCERRRTRHPRSASAERTGGAALSAAVDRPFGEPRVAITDELRCHIRPVQRLAPAADQRAHKGWNTGSRVLTNGPANARR